MPAADPPPAEPEIPGPGPSVSPASEPDIQAAGPSLSPTPPTTAGTAPRWWGNHLGELRWQLELAQLLLDPVYRGAAVPHGDGAPLIAVPGLLAGDGSLRILRGWLGRIGYDAHGAQMLANVACSDRALSRLELLAERLQAQTGRKLALIGHSRGAHLAKALAHRHPDWISAVISLGAGLDEPFAISAPTQAVVAALRTAYARTSDRVARNGCLTETCRCSFTQDFAGPFPPQVPLTSIYSKGDGVVRWRACVVPYAHCVEVKGSHVGLAFNRRVYRVLAHTLAEHTAGV